MYISNSSKIALKFSFNIVDKFQKLGRELGFQGEALQDFVKQQHTYEKAERAAERDLERDRIEAE